MSADFAEGVGSPPRRCLDGKPELTEAPRVRATAVPQSVPVSIQAKPRWGPRSYGEVSAHPCPRPGMIQPTPQESVGLFRRQGAPLQTGTQGTRAWLRDMPLRAVRARGPRLWQASPAAVRSGGPSEARPALPVGSDRAGSGAPAFRCGGWGEPQPDRRALQQRGEPDDPLHLEEQWVPRGSPRPDGEHTIHTLS